MSVFQIVFVLINLAVPVWWLSRSTHTDTHAIDWSVLQKNLDYFIESDGGFPPCQTLDVSDLIKNLCEESHEKLTPTDSTAIERASQHVVFSCEARKDRLIVSWRLEENPNERLKCAAGGEVINYGPGFEFALDGRMRALDFWSSNSVFETIPFSNCRAKANLAKSFTSAPNSRQQFLYRLGRMAHDPQDYITGNEMCLVFDPSPLWKPWREKLPR